MAGKPGESREAQREASRAGTRGSAGGGGRTSGGSGPNAPGGNQYAGYKGPTGTRAPTTDAPGSYGLSGPETRAYDSAKMEFKGRGFGKKLVDFLSPIKSVDPQINQPASYANGQYHHGFNPAGLAVGALAPYGSGALLGPAAAEAWNQAGMHDVVLTGPGGEFSTSFPDGGPGYNSSTGFAGPNNNPASPQGKGDQSGMAAALLAGGPTTSAPGGANFGAQPTPTPPAAPSMFAPKIPNHSLPQGYQSMFPNSLTEEDKKLLYAKALMGAA